eukprot:CAMPEP_0113844572 /NCGR_PEP_ID=MMETSP0372-20130328/305_1 /TAXON_ID=340204 /ORGANISM="Lankesteria abbotti" /LENGTH=180 /DNA_ID=CAMNT_0000813577 /DNA_START=581 /DNA_END=1123 /DNA_ORIENTATION=- /assembly_acc=CAM_ASM_000359
MTSFWESGFFERSGMLLNVSDAKDSAAIASDFLRRLGNKPWMKGHNKDLNNKRCAECRKADAFRVIVNVFVVALLKSPLESHQRQGCRLLANAANDESLCGCRYHNDQPKDADSDSPASCMWKVMVEGVKNEWPVSPIFMLADPDLCYEENFSKKHRPTDAHLSQALLLASGFCGDELTC